MALNVQLTLCPTVCCLGGEGVKQNEEQAVGGVF